jgi:hypothetical protein
MSAMQANVQPRQQNPVNQLVALHNGSCVQFFVGGNHLRAWLQTLPNGNTCYFMAVSEEEPCHSDGDDPIFPPLLWNWHCINPNGFNNEHDKLTAVFASGGSLGIIPIYNFKKESDQLYSHGTDTNSGSGSSIDNVPYDGFVDIITLQ